MKGGSNEGITFVCEKKLNQGGFELESVAIDSLPYESDKILKPYNNEFLQYH